MKFDFLFQKIVVQFSDMQILGFQQLETLSSYHERSWNRALFLQSLEFKFKFAEKHKNLNQYTCTKKKSRRSFITENMKIKILKINILYRNCCME